MSRIALNEFLRPSRKHRPLSCQSVRVFEKELDLSKCILRIRSSVKVAILYLSNELWYWCKKGWVCSWGKISFKMPGLPFSSKLDWGSYIISNANTASKKNRALIHSMKFLSPEIALYLYRSTIRPCIEYCCHVSAGAPSCYLELLDKLLKRIHIGLLVLHLLPLLSPWLIVEM